MGCTTRGAHCPECRRRQLFARISHDLLGFVGDISDEDGGDSNIVLPAPPIDGTQHSDSVHRTTTTIQEENMWRQLENIMRQCRCCHHVGTWSVDITQAIEGVVYSEVTHQEELLWERIEALPALS